MRARTVEEMLRFAHRISLRQEYDSGMFQVDVLTGPQSKKVVFSISEKCGTASHHRFTQVVKFLVGANKNQMHRRERGPGRSALLSEVKLAVARIGKRPKDDAGVFIDGMPEIHGEGENNDKEEEIDAKQRMQ
jgi:hypothetical protein